MVKIKINLHVALLFGEVPGLRRSESVNIIPKFTIKAKRCLNIYDLFSSNLDYIISKVIPLIQVFQRDKAIQEQFYLYIKIYLFAFV